MIPKTLAPDGPAEKDLLEAPQTSRIQLTRVIAMNSPNNRSIPELFSDAVGQLAKLIGNEFELASFQKRQVRQAGLQP
jgi:hypothetical protein